jgi:quinol monooxygenase YgiN
VDPAAIGLFSFGAERAVDVVVVQVFVRLAAPPERAQQIAEALRSLEVRARQDRGCESTTVSVSLEQPGRFVLQEEWSAEADLRRHIQSHDFTGVLALMEMSADRPVLEFRFVDHTRGLDYVAEVRGAPDSPRHAHHRGVTRGKSE